VEPLALANCPLYPGSADANITGQNDHVGGGLWDPPTIRRIHHFKVKI
jgi:hypothetical protein